MKISFNFYLGKVFINCISLKTISHVYPAVFPALMAAAPDDVTTSRSITLSFLLRVSEPQAPEAKRVSGAYALKYSISM
jgi:tRNA threonylcarbamoyladenosine modification (KEOPS) complex Cgi121 subunit